MWPRFCWKFGKVRRESRRHRTCKKEKNIVTLEKVLIVLSIAFLLGMALSPPVSLDSQIDGVEVFVRQGCPHCKAAKTFLKQLQLEDPQIRIRIRDLDNDPEALPRLTHLATKHGIQHIGVPTFYLRGRLIVGFTSPDTTGKQLRELLARPPPQSKQDLPDGVCALDITEPCTMMKTRNPSAGTTNIIFPFLGSRGLSDLGLPLFTVLLGLLDGFNPCAMWVLLFLLSLLATLRDRQKMFLIAGTFVGISGLVYFAFMAAWLNVFLIIGYSRVTQLLLGGIAMLIGGIHIKDFFAFRKGISFTIPESAKPGLYARMRRIIQAKNISGALIAIIVLAAMVNLVELACTAGLPALYTQTLARQGLKWWEYYSYLGLYNVAYIADDALMVTIGVITLSHRKLQEREGRWLKLLSGIVMVVLGIILIGAPGWLA